MQVAIIGAGPTGLFLGTGLARRGHEVTLVDRDPGPRPDGSWPRRGVMQFAHAHAFRPQVADALRAEMPEAYDAWLALGAEPIEMEIPGFGLVGAGTRSQRVTFERAVRGVAERQPGLRLRLGHVEGVEVERGRAVGIRVDGAGLTADLVIDASGRSGRATRGLGPRFAVGGPCAIVYTDRLYQLRPGAEPGPLVNPIAWQGDFTGFQVLVFVHERGIFSVLIIRNKDDAALLALREAKAFEAACRAIPALAEWTDPERARPLGPVLPGGNLMNHYGAQTGLDGGLLLPGLVFAGDTVCTTTPNFGRGVTTSLLQARELLRLVDVPGADLRELGEEFDVWCNAHMRPWAEDHVHMDDQASRRWRGEEIDLGRRLPSDLIMMAGRVEPRIDEAAGAYLTMTEGPACLDQVEPLARAVYAGGWRPTPTPGPTRDELAEIVRGALTPA
jgi:2-polyprenyl-6-methoxyphenol hydroxylase-like FAD-dependent oxidoreductase